MLNRKNFLRKKRKILEGNVGKHFSNWGWETFSLIRHKSQNKKAKTEIRKKDTCLHEKDPSDQV